MKNIINIKRNSKISAISLILVLTISTFILFLPTVNAQDVDTYAFIAVFPNPIGVNQTAVVNMWVQPLQPTGFDFFHGFMLTITNPDGNDETVGPFTTQATGSTWFEFTPVQVGTFTFQFSYPGETFTSTGEYYKPTTSQETELTVQQESIPPYPTEPLPTGYWERPISAENREWASISGNWLMDGYNSTVRFPYNSGVGYNPYSEAPMSSHIMWTRELTLGGLVGGEYGSTSYYSYNDYETFIIPPIIMNGRLYYQIYESEFRDSRRPGFVCVDLRTGEELWRNTEGSIDIGQLYDYRSGNQMGVRPWLWDIGFLHFGGVFIPHTYKMYDAFTGDVVISFENGVTGGVPVYGSDGSMYLYFLDGINNWLAMWNLTKALEANGLIYYEVSGEGYLRPTSPYFISTPGGTYDWSTGLEWNVTIPDLPDHPGYDAITGPILGSHIQSIMGDVIFATVETFAQSYYEIGFDKNTGERLWIHNTTQWTWSRAYGEGVYTDFYSPNMTWSGYDVNTGNQLWRSDPQVYPWGLYNGGNKHIAEGKLIVPSYDGYVHAFDITNGNEVWKYYGGDSTETPYGHNPFYYGPIIAGGVVFAGQGEHSPTQPFLRGLNLHAINLDTGEGIWNITGSMNLAAIADGYLLGINGYDNKLYCFGKGPSAITVETPMTAVPKGSSVMITGTVTDQSSGQKGTPAIDDEDMSAWMEYLHMQKPMPEDAAGVTVILDAVDPSGNFVNIGTTTSDLSGNFGYKWTPTLEGTYKIIATFEGSASYGSSSDTTYLAVDPATAPAEPIQPEAQAPLITTEVAILIAVVVIAAVAIAAYWVLRRR